MWFKKVFVLVLILFFGALLVAPRTQVVHNLIQSRIVSWYEQSLDCSVTCERFSCSFLLPAITLENVTVASRDAASSWRWDCKRATMRSSLLGVIFRGVFDLSITLDDVKIASRVRGSQVDLVEGHLQRYFSGKSSLPIRMQRLAVQNADCLLRDEECDAVFQVTCSCEYKKMGANYGFNVLCDDGTVTYSSQVLAQKLKGSWQSDLDWPAGKLLVSGQGQGELTLFDGEYAELCNWEGKYADDTGMLTLWRSQSDDHVKILLKKAAATFAIDATIKMALSRCVQHLIPSVYAHMVRGELNGSYHAALGTETHDGLLTLTINNAGYGKHELFKEAVFLLPIHSDSAYQGDLSLTLSQENVYKGSWSWLPEKREGSARFVNNQGEELGLFSLKPDPKHLQGYLAAGSLSILQEDNQEGSILLKASAHYNKGALRFQAERGKEQFFLEGNLGKVSRITVLRWIDGTNKTLIDLNYGQSEGHSIAGIVDIGAIKRLAKHVWGFDLHGEGIVDVRGHYTKGRYELLIDASKLAVRLPHIYNVVNALTGTFTFDPQKSLLEISHVLCTLHRGSLSVDHAQVRYDNEAETLVADVPCTLTSFWFNLEKDLYALFSGSLTFKRTGTAMPILSGELSVDRAHVSESAFKVPLVQQSQQGGSLSFKTQASPIGLDVTVRSKNSVRVVMERLDGQAHVDMHIGNTTAEPSLAGIVRVATGTIMFPYKPLMVRKAQLIFSTQQSYDPVIEVLAKNKIKGYDISLHINGTFSSYDMQLQSAPPLSEEQIMGLLYAGTEQGALATDVAHNLRSIFFKNGSDSASNGHGKKGWREALKHIHLVPSFTDQHGRGGLRGTVEVEINDRWRALMQKNFSLSEDTRFELNYDVSDDMCVRALRDERRDIGAEVEMKVKF